MIQLTDMVNTYNSRPAVVLGGGPTLLADYETVTKYIKEPVTVAVNEHPFYVGITEPDFLVFMDNPVHNPLLWNVVKEYAGVKVSHDLRYTDVNMAGVGYWNGPGSGIVACWFACYLGCEPVILCGFDLYQGEKKYCHRDEIYDSRSVFEVSLDEHLIRWKAGFRRCPNIHRVRAVSGPLVDVFGEYVPDSTQVPD